MADVNHSDRLALAITAYTDEDDALALANGTDFGLAGTVWTTDLNRGLALARPVNTGTIGINSYQVDLSAPFSGVKPAAWDGNSAPRDWPTTNSSNPSTSGDVNLPSPSHPEDSGEPTRDSATSPCTRRRACVLQREAPLLRLFVLLRFARSVGHSYELPRSSHVTVMPVI